MGIWCQNDVVSTLMRRNHVASTLIRRHFYVMCPLSYQNVISNCNCTTIHRDPIFSTRYCVMCKVYSRYCSKSEIEHGLCACTVDNPLAEARGLSLRTGAQTMLYLSYRGPDKILRKPTSGLRAVRNPR